MTTTMTLAPYRALIVAALIVIGFLPAMFAQAAVADISATPTQVTTGQPSRITWYCSPGSNASLNQGIGTVTNTGSMDVYPSVTKTYTITCTDSTSSAAKSVNITVSTQGCYEDAYLEGVYGNEVANTYSESISANNIIFDEEGSNSLNGGGAYDSQNHYQQCINACAEYGNCTYKQIVDFSSGETSQSRFTCRFADPDQGTRSAKPMESQYYVNGNLRTETTWHAIVWKQNSGGTCPVLPPLPTVTLTANPTAIQTGQSSTLTWSSTNADYCTRSGGTFANTPPTANAVSGNKSVSPTATTDYYVTCYNEAGSAQTSARVTVGSAPDLTAGTITPTQATAGQSTTFTTTVTNSGNASTGASFSVLFQSATSATGSGVQDLGTKTQTTLAANSGPVSVTFNHTFTTAGNVYMRACADKPTGTHVNGVIVESNENNNCGGWTLVNVVAGQTYPNLTATIPSPSSAVMGTAKQFTSTITNNGGATTGTGFTNVIIVNNTPDFTTPIATYTDTSPQLLSNGTDGISATHTFTATGDFYVGACADRNASGAGSIFESNETDNCNWRLVNVTSTGTPSGGELTCSVTTTAVDTGTRANFTVTPDHGGRFTWTVTPVEPNTPDSTGRPEWTHIFATDGFYSVDVDADNGASGRCLVTAGDPCVNPDIDLVATPDRVNIGGTTVLSVSATGVSGSQCTISGGGWTSAAIPVNMCSVEATTFTPPAIQTQTAYTITCGDDTATAIVNVIPKFQEF